MAMQWIALLAASFLAGCAWVGRRRGAARLDTLYFCATFPFAVLALLDLLGAAGALSGVPMITASRVTYQCMILGVTALIMALVRDPLALRKWMFVGQAVLGFGFALLPLADARILRLPLWAAFNVAMTLTFVLMLAHALWRRGGTRGWLLLLTAVPAVGVMIDDLLDAVGQPVGVSWGQVFYTPLLALIWLVATRRVKMHIGSARSVRRARARMAQDLHDGVGGHLSSIISALKTDAAHERAIVARLQECLLELKLLVDGEAEDLPVLALLASLRYRMEPLFAAVGIRVEWDVIPHARLDVVRDARARHILRIAQEAFANVVQHSQASRLTVHCSYLESQGAVKLEVVDNGVAWCGEARDGREQAHAHGKGVRGMHERARLLGGRLTIETASAGSGTRVTLWAPVRAPD
jgi:signal transduction histidine kinase